MAYVYDENSFLAGIAVGMQMKGWATYSSWDPIIIVPPVTEKFPPILFGRDKNFSIAPMMDAVETGFTNGKELLFEESMGVIIFKKDAAFGIQALNERVVFDEVITAFSIDKDINPLEYDETIVFIDSSGAFTMDQMTREFVSTEQTIDVGTMQELTVVTDEFAEVATQEVTT